jgi:hypothetical protein
MIDATIAPARLRDLARPGRSRPVSAGGAGPASASVSRRRSLDEAASLAD